MNDLSGQSFGRYHLVEKLGEGGMAVVYKAFDTRLECEVAVKIIRTDQLAPAVLERALKRFEREAKAVAQLTHPNIVKVSDYGEENELPYLVMPYLAGGTLKKYLGKLMPYGEAARMLLPVSKALQYAHSRNIIHRDVKPSNILITESGEPMLTDFGIAKILDLQDSQTLTGTGVGIGTPEYMAPEQWTGEITPAVDIYSLGVVFYELVTGHKPYTADTPAAVLIKTINDPLPRPGSYVEELPGEVENVIFKAMAKKAIDRYASMTEFSAALNLLARDDQLSARAATNPVFSPIVEESNFSTTDELETREGTSENETRLEEHSAVLPELNSEQSPILVTELSPGLDEPGMVDGKQAWRILGAIIGVVALLVLIGGGVNGWFSPKATVAPAVEPAATEAPVYATEAPAYDETGSNISAWPMARHDTLNSGFVSSESYLTPPLNLLWSTDEPNFYIDNITASSGKIAIAGMPTENDGNNNELIMRDGSNGSFLWSYILPNGGVGAMDVYPLFYNGKVYVGGQHDTKFYALDEYTGGERWIIGDISDMYASNYIQVNGILYLPDSQYGAVAIDAESGSILWGQFSGTWGDDIAYDQGMVFTIYRNSNLVEALDASTGAVLWTYQLSSVDFFSRLMIYEQNLILTNTATNEVMSFNIYDGSLQWSRTADLGTLTSGWGAVAYGKAYIPTVLDSGEGELLALDVNTGDLLWSVGNGGGWVSGLAVANQIVYMTSGSESGSVIALDADTGNSLWQYPLNGPGSEVVVANGVLYVSSYYSVYAFGN